MTVEALSLEDELDFGKHKGKTVREVLRIDSGYIIWCISSNVKTFANEVVINLIEHDDEDFFPMGDIGDYQDTF